MRAPITAAAQVLAYSAATAGLTLFLQGTASAADVPALPSPPQPASVLKDVAPHAGEEIGIGDARPSDPASKPAAPGDSNPPPNRANAGVVPRVGAGINPQKQAVRWSFDWRNPLDTNAATDHVQRPKPRVERALPGNLIVAQNHASHLENENRTAEGPRRNTNVNNSDWNLTTTDAGLPGQQRLLRFDMVCPNHTGWAGHGGSHAAHDPHGGHDGNYTGATEYDLKNRHLVFSYQWGDRLLNDEFIEAHHIAYGLSNDS